MLYIFLHKFWKTMMVAKILMIIRQNNIYLNFLFILLLQIYANKWISSFFSILFNYQNIFDFLIQLSMRIIAFFVRSCMYYGDNYSIFQKLSNIWTKLWFHLKIRMLIIFNILSDNISLTRKSVTLFRNCQILRENFDFSINFSMLGMSPIPLYEMP